MSTTLESSIIRIRRTHDNMVVGAGFLVTEKLVLTCARVVCEALGISQDSLEIPTQEVSLDFALVAPGDILTAKVVEWLPVSNLTDLFIFSSILNQLTISIDGFEEHFSVKKASTPP